MKSITKRLLILCLLSFGINEYRANCQQNDYLQIDSAIFIKFQGEPVKTFCQSALGDVTSLKYDSHNDSGTYDYICEISIYKNIRSATTSNKDTDFLKFIVSSEEMSVHEQNGKILEKKDSTFLNLPGLLYKIYFSDIKDENSKGWINRSLYFKYDNSVVKLATYIPQNKSDNITSKFFSSVRINP
jgi:hypothetical protein